MKIKYILPYLFNFQMTPKHVLCWLAEAQYIFLQTGYQTLGNYFWSRTVIHFNTSLLNHFVHIFVPTPHTLC